MDCVPLALPVPPSAGSTGKASGTHQNTTDLGQGRNAANGSDFRTSAIVLRPVVASKRVSPSCVVEPAPGLAQKRLTFVVIHFT